MGADGHIAIWKHSEVIEAFSDAAKLFMCLQNTYKDTLDGVEYWHSYWGDNLGDYWACRDDWLLDNDVDVLRLAEFVGWLSVNYTEWEVWGLTTTSHLPPRAGNHSVSRAAKARDCRRRTKQGGGNF
jgi:hypothetical protein